MWPPVKRPIFAILAAAVVQFSLGGFLKIFSNGASPRRRCVALELYMILEFTYEFASREESRGFCLQALFPV